MKLFNPDEIDLMIEKGATHERDKAIVATLFESGVHSGELLSVEYMLSISTVQAVNFISLKEKQEKEQSDSFSQHSTCEDGCRTIHKIYL